MRTTDKEIIINAAVMSASKILVHAFRTCNLETHIETMIVDDNTGDEFILKFYSSKGFDRFLNEAKNGKRSEAE